MAVPENDDGVTDVHEFLNVVADEKDRTVSVPHFVDEPVHHVPALPAQGGGGLINDEKLGFGTFGPGNFQKLALLKGHEVNHLGRVDSFYSDFVQDLGCRSVHGFQIQQAGLGELLLPAGKDICCYADVVEGTLLLDHHSHTLGDGIGDVSGIIGLAVQVELPFILLLDAGHDRGEGGLAGAVLSNQADHLAPLDLKADLDQGLGGSEAFADSLRTEDDLFFLAFAHSIPSLFTNSQ